ncbi:hypothetical protein RFI_29416, partial [Reticulomyxa filosa]
TVQSVSKSEYNDVWCNDDMTCDVASAYDCQFNYRPTRANSRTFLESMGYTDKTIAVKGWNDLAHLRTRYFGMYCSGTLTITYYQSCDVAVQLTPSPTKRPTSHPSAPPTKQPTKTSKQIHKLPTNTSAISVTYNSKSNWKSFLGSNNQYSCLWFICNDFVIVDLNTKKRYLSLKKYNRRNLVFVMIEQTVSQSLILKQLIRHPTDQSSQTYEINEIYEITIRGQR